MNGDGDCAAQCSAGNHFNKNKNARESTVNLKRGTTHAARSPFDYQDSHRPHICANVDFIHLRIDVCREIPRALRSLHADHPSCKKKQATILRVRVNNDFWPLAPVAFCSAQAKIAVLFCTQFVCLSATHHKLQAILTTRRYDVNRV